MVKFHRCADSIWFKNLQDVAARDYTLRREFISPVFGLIKERRDPHKWEGFGSLTVEMADPTREDTDRAIGVIQKSQDRQAFSEWMETLWAINRERSLDLPRTMAAFEALPDRAREHILEAMIAVFEEADRSRRISLYTKGRPEFSFPVTRENIKVIEMESPAYMRLLEAAKVMEGPEAQEYLREARELLKKAAYAVFEGEARHVTRKDLGIMLDWAYLKGSQIVHDLDHGVNAILKTLEIAGC